MSEDGDATVARRKRLPRGREAALLAKNRLNRVASVARKAK